MNVLIPFLVEIIRSKKSKHPTPLNTTKIANKIKLKDRTKRHLKITDLDEGLRLYKRHNELKSLICFKKTVGKSLNPFTAWLLKAYNQCYKISSNNCSKPIRKSLETKYVIYVSPYALRNTAD